MAAEWEPEKPENAVLIQQLCATHSTSNTLVEYGARPPLEREPPYNTKEWISTGDIYLKHLPDGSCVAADSNEYFVPIEWIATEDQDSKFELFRSLPIELRMMIWSLLLPGPRVLHLVSGMGLYSFSALTAGPLGKPFDMYAIWRMGDSQNDELKNSMKMLMLTCKESRNVFHDNYKPITMLESTIASLWEEDAEPSVSTFFFQGPRNYAAYVDCKRDTFYFSGPQVQSLASFGAWIGMSRLSNLAIRYSPDTSDTTFGNAAQVSKFLEQCPRLRVLKIVIMGPPGDPWYREWGRYHFVEVDNTFDSVITHNPDIDDEDNPQLSQSERSSGLRHCRDAAMTIRADFESIISNASGRWPRIDWEVCLVGGVGGGCDREDYDTLNLIPAEPKYHGVTYNTNVIRKLRCSPEHEHRVWIEVMGCYASCDHDGTPYTAYDGEAMKNLFLEDFEI